ncbi:MAG TPA: reverse transcriptase domain-containing protein, partial [Flavobacteriales bacterium]|nr:reverse transcriptase domain-containing protein [Flavobacteriales bacterium]
ILAELAFDSMDKILLSHKIRFVRFVDDIHIFCRTQEEAHAHLNLLAMKLMTNEGLTLQKHKTQILTKSEFVNLVASRLNAETDDGKVQVRARFMALPIRYDPYSPTADDDYEKIKADLQEFNVLDLLNEELRKTKIHQQFSKHLLRALTVLEDSIVSRAISSIADRIELLYPIFPNLMIAIFSNYDRLDVESRAIIMSKLRELVAKDSYMLQVELNVAYMVRVLGKEASGENQEVLVGLFQKFNSSVLVRSWVMQVFTNWRLEFWLSDIKPNFGTMTKWERRIFILSSFVLGDEGKHWREHNKKGFTKAEYLVRDWGAQKFQQPNWQLPL